MANLIEKFEKGYKLVWGDGSVHNYHESLEIMDWGNDSLVAYTFNSDDENLVELFIEALKKYKKLEFHDGVSGYTCHCIIQSNVERQVKELLKDDVRVEYSADHFTYIYENNN